MRTISGKKVLYIYFMCTWYILHDVHNIYTGKSIYIFCIILRKYIYRTLKNRFRNEKTEDKTGKPCTYDRLPIVPNAYIIKMSSPTNNTGMYVENIVLIWEAIVYIIIILCRLYILLNVLRQVLTLKHRDGTPYTYRL